MRITLLAVVSLFTFLLVLPAAGAEDEPGAKKRGAGGGPWSRLGRMDADGDGKVTREEFRGPERLFARLDADGDGAVTRKEAEAMRGRGQGRGTGGMQRRGRGLSLDKLDANKDGKVTEAEWKAFFDKADENGDDILQDEEWAAAIGGGPLKDDAPKVGAPAPKVKAMLMDLPVEVDLGAPKRTTVLVFGSWT